MSLGDLMVRFAARDLRRRRQLDLGLAPPAVTPECIACDLGDHTNCGGDEEEVPCGCWCRGLEEVTP